MSPQTIRNTFVAEKKEPGDQTHISFRRVLVDVCLVSFLLLCVTAIRCMFTLVDELRLLRVETTVRLAATQSMLQSEGKDLSSDLSKLAVNSSVLIDRIDSQLTHARTEMADVAKATKATAEKESKKIQNTLTQNRKSTAEKLETIADNTESKTTPAPEIKVIVPDSGPKHASTPVATSVDEDKVITLPTPEQQPKETPGKWKQFWHHLTQPIKSLWQH